MLKVVFNLPRKGATSCLLCLAQHYSIHLYRVRVQPHQQGGYKFFPCLAKYYRSHPHRLVFNLPSKGAMSCLMCTVVVLRPALDLPISIIRVATGLGRSHLYHLSM